MASTDSLPVPQKNVAYRVVFPIYDNTGSVVTGATGLDSEVSKDQGTFADCTNEATEIATSSGIYYLDLSSTEMNADCVAIIVKTTTTNAKTSVLVLYPQEVGDIRVNVTYWNGTAVASPATAGIPDINVKNMNNVAATSVTTINANVGTTQPQNFTGTGASALVKGDTVDIAGAAVSTSTAQIGVNAVNVGGTAQTGRDIGASVLLSSGTGAGQLDFTSGVVKANLAQILGTALTETAGLLAGGFKKFFNIATPAATMDHGILVDTVTATTTATNLTTNNDKTGYGLSSAAVQSIWDALTSALTTVGSIGKRLADNIDVVLSTRLATSGYTTPPTVGAIADQVWDEPVSGHNASATFGQALFPIRSGTAQAGAATTVTLDASASAVDNFYSGQIVYLTGGTGALQGRVILSYVGSTKVATVSAWATNPDNTSVFVVLNANELVNTLFSRVGAPVGATLSADVAAVKAVLPAALVSGRMDASVGAYQAGLTPLQPTTAGRTLDVAATGEAGLDFDNIRDASGAHTLTNITVPLVTTATTATNLTNAPTAGDFTATMKTSLNAATPAVTVSDKTGFSLSTAGILAIWHQLTSAIVTPATIGKLLLDNVDAAISSRSSHTAADVWAVATRILTAGTNIVLAKGTGVTGFNDPTAGAIADGVWDETLADHLGAGSTGAGLNAASSAGDPWATTLPGAYGSGTAGKIVGDNVNATISSRSSHSAADVWAVATRLLTAGTNIVLAKGIGVTGFNDLSTAQVNAEADTALADYDGPTNAEMVARTLLAANYFDPTMDGVIVGTNNDKTGYSLTVTPPTAAQIWATLVPGAFLSGSAGYILGNIVSGLTAEDVWTYVERSLTIYNPIQSLVPINLSSQAITIIRGDDYTDDRALSWTVTNGPDLTGADVVFRAKQDQGGGVIVEIAATSVTSTTVTVDLTSAQSALFSHRSHYHYELEATLLTGQIVTVVIAPLFVIDDIR